MTNTANTSVPHRRIVGGGPLVWTVTIMCLMMLMSSSTLAETVTYQDSWGQAGFNLVHQDDDGVEIVFSVPSLELNQVDINGEGMTAISISGVFLPNNAGAPNLPGTGRYIAVPQGAQAHLQVLGYRTEVLHDMDVAPAFEIPLESDDSPLKYEKDMAIYGTNAYYPAEPVTMSEPMEMRGVDAVIVGVTPFQYNPVTRDLMVYKDIRLQVTFSGGNGHFGEDALRNRWWEPILQQNLLNYESLPQVDFNRVRHTDEDNVEYVIIVPNDPDFLAWADTLKQWRNQQGIITGITTLSEIGGNNYSLIENYINNAYYNWSIRPVAVLLLSDYQSTGDLYGITANFYSYSSYNCVSDNFYADITGDHLPDIVLARICAQNNLQLQRMITKMLTYERQPCTQSGFYRIPLIAGGWQTERWFILCCEVIYGYFANVHDKIPHREYAIYSGTPGSSWSSNQNTYLVVNYFGPSGLGYIPASPPPELTWYGNASGINNSINAGAFVVQHRDHGSPTGWGEPSYHNTNLVGLSNTTYPYIFSMNCSTGEFDYPSECFTEAIHRMEYGALGVLAASNVSYSFVNDVLCWGIYDGMWPNFDPGYGADPVGEPNLRPGFGNVSGKYYLQASSWPYNPQNKDETYYLFHHHGDAFMTIYSEIPHSLSVTHADSIAPGDTSFTVTANDGALIGLTVDGEVVGSAEATGAPVPVTVTPPMPTGATLKVTVTKANYYRYTANVETSTQGPAVPSAIEDLTISVIGPNIGLSWSPVTTDTSGNTIAISYYNIYMSTDNPNFIPTPADSIDHVLPPSTNYLDTDAHSDIARFYNVKAIVE